MAVAMTGQITALVKALREAINVRSSTRASVFKDVDRKLNELMAAHTEFSRIIRHLENGVSGMLRIPEDEYSTQEGVRRLQERVRQLDNIYHKATEARDERRASRRLLYEEARTIASSPSPIIAGILKYMDEEEEARVRIFMNEIIQYFTSTLSRNDEEQEYNHDLRAVLGRLHRRLYRFEEDICSSKISKTDLTKRSKELNRIMKATLHDLTAAEKAFDGKWGRIAQAYAEVRQKLLSPNDMQTVADVGEMFLGQASSLSGQNLGQKS